MDILYGRNPVLEALRAGRGARKIVIAEGTQPERRLAEILERATSAGLVVEHVARRRIDDITHTEHHQGVAGYFHSREPLALEQLITDAGMPALLVALDGIQDPQNLGAIARSADAVGADGLILPRHRAATVTPAVAKASAGATEHLRVATVGNLAQCLDVLAGAGYWRVGLDGEATTRYDDVDYTPSVVIVIGAEGRGLGDRVRKNCDVLVALPMVGKVESLNAAAASAVVLYEVARQRNRARTQ